MIVICTCILGSTTLDVSSHWCRLKSSGYEDYIFLSIRMIRMYISIAHYNYTTKYEVRKTDILRFCLDICLDLPLACGINIFLCIFLSSWYMAVNLLLESSLCCCTQFISSLLSDTKQVIMLASMLRTVQKLWRKQKAC